VWAAPVPDGPDAARAARAVVDETLVLLKGWLAAWNADERLAETRLVVVTRGGVAAAEGETPDLAQAPVWGIVRSAQIQHPGRFVLVDVADPDVEVAWPTLLAADEPQLAVRVGQAFAPQLARAAREASIPSALEPEGTVLLTGGTGALGALVARHLATA